MPQTLRLFLLCRCEAIGFRARPGPHAARHTRWRAMYGHVWHHARAAAGGRARAAVVSGTDDAGRERLGHGLGFVAPARGACVQL